MISSRPERIANYVILLAFAAFALWPILSIVVTALGPESASVAREGRTLHWENFSAAWVQGSFARYMATSVVVSVLVVSVSVVCSIMAGYALGTMRFRGQGVLFYVFLLGIMVPTEAIIVPLYFDLRSVGLTNTIWGVALPQIAQSIAFGTYWMRAYFRSSNASIMEAARLDGAGTHRVLWQVLVPIGRPAITTQVLLTFMWTWNEFLIPLVMSPAGRVRTAPWGWRSSRASTCRGRRCSRRRPCSSRCPSCSSTSSSSGTSSRG
ncbi:carbohydrate ABC transporter permease [Cellulomonas sp. ATA003]|uniref:carbohydrate ABC transporter permease n=1 Tax=Cellulomonas sp. ATA003 TaxID=3073064 RepID=UPI0028731B68|nr:carbohydrate ABC transporter permease [Cellulomonas sp. ATA003]WNB86647.1 carbohydrate ABC transporter permease [Cellulomonas sp. ATA003]